MCAMEHNPAVGTSFSAEMMLEHLPVGVALFDAHDLRLLQANPCYHASLAPEWQQGRAIGHRFTEFVPQAEYSGSADLFRQVAATGVPYKTEAYASAAVRERGLTYWDWSLNPICDADGQVSHLLLTLIDATARVVAQQQAEQARTALEQTNQVLEVEQQRGKLLKTLTQRIGRLLRAEDIACNALDVLQTSLRPLTSALYVHEPVHQCFRALALTLPDEHESWKRLSQIPYNRCSALLQGLQEPHTILRSRLLDSASDPESDALLQAIPDAGTVVYLPLWYKETCEGVLAIVFAQVLPKNAPLVQIIEGLASLLAETLASAHLYAIIDRQRQRFYAVLDQLPEGVLLVEAAGGTISYANPAASSLLDVPHTSLVGRSLHQLDVSRSGQEASAVPWHFTLVHALWGKTISNQELLVKRADGRHIILLSSAAPLRLEAGENISEAVIAFQDITIQKTIEQQKSTFMAMVNHELRTPLTSVLGFCDLLQQHGLDGLNQMQAYAITSIAEQSEYLTYLVNEVLDHSTFERASFELHRAYQDLLPLLMQAIEQHKSTNPEYHIHLHMEVSSQVCLMGQFDAYRIIQVLNNVLTNAVKYSLPGSEIEVGVRLGDENGPERNTVLLWVKDQGSGIAPADLPHIFERFYRAEKRDQSVGGLGLGLYLAKELIRRHGGRIWAESTEGVGSTFFLVLPLSRVVQKNPS
jgi:signal transduction histidine kinase